MVKKIVPLLLIILTISVIFASARAANNAEWTSKASLPQLRADLPAVSYNGIVYVFGGYYDSGNAGQGQVYAYNPTTDSWTQKSSMSYARWGCAATVWGSEAYVFGGEYQGSKINRVEAYNFATDSWVTKHNMPTQISNQGLETVAAGGLIYLFYGSYTFSYNPLSDSFSQLASAPYNKDWAECAYINIGGEDRIYILGGFDMKLGAVDTCAYFRPAHNDWVVINSAPYAAYGTLRDNPVIDGIIYYGYGQGPSAFYSYLYSFNPSTGIWTQLPSGTYPRDGVGCAVIGSKLYVIGGRNTWSSPIMGLRYNEQFDTKTAIHVDISPTQVTMYTIGQSQTFTSNMRGGNSPFSYQWVLNGAIVSEATNPSWTFTPKQEGNYQVYVLVTDSVGNKAQSNVANIQLYGKFPLTMYTNYGTVSPGSGQFVVGSHVSISATAPQAAADERYVWRGWVGTGSGSYTGMSHSVEITINGAITETAQWELQYNVCFLSSGINNDASGTITSIDSSAKAFGDLPYSLWLKSSSSVNFVYSNIVSTNNAGKQYALANVNASSPVIITGPITVAGSYKTQFLLTATSPYDIVSGSRWYDSGSTAYLTLIHGIITSDYKTRYVFSNWSGDASGTNYAQSNTIIMNRPQAATANWKTQYYLTVSTSHGNVQGEDWYDAGTTAHIAVPQTASEANGTQYTFSNWSGDIYGTSPSTETVVDSPKTIVANWKTQYLVTNIVTPLEAGIITSGTIAGEDSIIRLSVSPSYGYAFLSWSTSSENMVIQNPNASSTLVTINGPGTITANLVAFQAEQIDNTPTSPEITTTPEPTNLQSPKPTPNQTASSIIMLPPALSPTTEPSNSIDYSEKNQGLDIIRFVAWTIVLAEIMSVATFYIFRKEHKQAIDYKFVLKKYVNEIRLLFKRFNRSAIRHYS